MNMGEDWIVVFAPQGLLGISLKQCLKPNSKSFSLLLSFVQVPTVLDFSSRISKPQSEPENWGEGKIPNPNSHRVDEMYFPCPQNSAADGAAQQRHEDNVSQPRASQEEQLCLLRTTSDLHSKIPGDKPARGQRILLFWGSGLGNLPERKTKQRGCRSVCPRLTATKTCIHTIKKPHKTFLEMD